MAVEKLKFNNRGFQKLLKDRALNDLMMAEARKLAAAAGDGFEAARSFSRTKRPRVGVYTATDEARQAEATERSLTRAVGRHPAARRRR